MSGQSGAVASAAAPVALDLFAGTGGGGALRALGIRSGLKVLALTAVNRSASYWRRRGFCDYSGDGVLAAKLASYADDAVYMISEV